MSLASNTVVLTWNSGNVSQIVLSGETKVSDVVDVLAANATGVAIGLALQITCDCSAHVRTDQIEILSSPDNSRWDSLGNSYASYSLAGISGATQALGTAPAITQPLAYAENVRYLKVRVVAPVVAGSSYTYTVTLTKVTA